MSALGAQHGPGLSGNLGHTVLAMKWWFTVVWPSAATRVSELGTCWLYAGTPFLSTPFEFHILLFLPYFCQLHFSAVLSFFFFRQSVRIEPHVTISGRVCQAKPKIKPYNQPLEPHTEHPQTP